MGLLSTGGSIVRQSERLERHHHNGVVVQANAHTFNHTRKGSEEQTTEYVYVYVSSLRTAVSRSGRSIIMSQNSDGVEVR